MHIAAVVTDRIVSVWTDDGLFIAAQYAERHGEWVGCWNSLSEALDAWYGDHVYRLVTDDEMDAAADSLQQLVQDLQHPQS